MEHIDKINKNPFEEIDKLTINELENIIMVANDKYYNTSQPIVSDEIFDILVDFLKEKAPKSIVLKQIGAKVKTKNKVKLDYWLGSMDKIKPNTKDLENWKKKYNGPYYLSDKLDGISALLIYRTNKKINLYTRGTASEGTDITPLLKYFNIPSWDDINGHLRASKEDIVLALRGEIIMSKNKFQNNWSDTMKNARNAVAGLVNSKTINPKMGIDTELILYEVVDPILKIKDQFNNIQKLNFKCVNYKKLDDISDEILSEYLKERRAESEYIIDGIIITNNDIHERNTNKNPEYAFAFKDILEDQKGISKVISVEWSISKDGYIKPVIIIEKILIAGVDIQRVTGNNAKFIVDNKIGIGAVLEIIRSGDVIPKVNKVVKVAKKISLPEGKWHWNETEVDIICDDLDTDDVLIKNIYHFFKTLDTKGLGEKVVAKLVDGGLDTIKKILQATKEDILKCDGFKEKSSLNLINSIKDAITFIPLSKIMHASNLLGYSIGVTKSKIILEAYPDFIDNKWSKKEFIDNLNELDGFDTKTSTMVATNFKDFLKFYNSIKDLITIEKPKEKKIIKNNKYKDKIFVFSGFRSEELKKKLEEVGAIVKDTIGKTTDYLVVKDKDAITSKITKAIELGITILNINEVF
jgi:NAD-dependent DNA ligase